MTNVVGHSDVEAVRAATDLVRLIGEHVPLKPKGREYLGLCPFHEDHKPSMHVVTHKGEPFYHCFACGATGDAFRFVMDYHKMSFGEALRLLADRAGVTLKPRREAAAESGDGPTRDELRRAMQFAVEEYQRCLRRETDAAKSARDELARRGIDAESIERFLIGYAPQGFDHLLTKVGTSERAKRIAEAAGLLKRRAEGGGYDAFRNRIIFPICDDAGRPIALGGRILNPEDQPKYLNSSESGIFHKSRTLYGLHLARRSIIHARQAIVTEGYTDVIACHRAGITNVVGTLGTALTKEHAATLSRLCDSVVLVFDGDEAGQKAADNGLAIFFSEPVDIRICTIPDGADPDDLLRQPDGRARLEAAIAVSVDAFEYKLRRFGSAIHGEQGLAARDRALDEFIRQLVELGLSAVSGVRKRPLFTKLADLTGVPLPVLERAIADRSRATPLRSARELEAKPAEAVQAELEPASILVSRARRVAEHDVLAILLFEPDAGIQPAIDHAGAQVTIDQVLSAGDFADETARAIAAFLFSAFASGESPSMAQVLRALPDRAAAATAGRLFAEGRRRCEDGVDASPVDALRRAVEALRGCIERDSYMNDSSAAPVAQTGGTEHETVLRLLERRRRAGDLHAAISQGVRI